MISDAFVRVICDKCNDTEEEISLTATARGYDDRGVDQELESLGWSINEDEHTCPDCQEQEAQHG